MWKKEKKRRHNVSPYPTPRPSGDITKRSAFTESILLPNHFASCKGVQPFLFINGWVLIRQKGKAKQILLKKKKKCNTTILRVIFLSFSAQKLLQDSF